MKREIIKKLDEYFDAYAEAWPLSGAFLVAGNGEVLFKKAYGMANRELDVPNNTDTRFLICSITKAFTATAIMMLHERGLLNVYDDFRKYIPYYPDNGEAITIYNLLTHTSGIQSYTNEEDFVGKTERLEFSKEELVDRFKNKPLEFHPGERGEYCNAGYYLLGIIIEKVSNQTYGEFLTENIFKPLGMDNTGMYHQDMILKNRAYPYTFEGENYMNGRFVEMKNLFSAGALYSTVDDMLLWDRALHGGRLLSRESLDKMFTPYRCIDQVIPYGCGFFVTEIFNRRRVGHEGGLNGYLTQYYHFIDDDVTYIILGNIIQNIWKMSDDIPAILFGNSYELPKKPVRIDVDKEILDEYSGKYRSESGNCFLLSSEGCKVFMEIDNSRYEVTPVDINKFVHKLIDETYEIQKDEDGKYFFKLYGDTYKKL